MLRLGSFWRTSQGEEFRINEVRTQGVEVWVHYTNTQSGQEYSCLADAFRARFSPVVNQRHAYL